MPKLQTKKKYITRNHLYAHIVRKCNGPSYTYYGFVKVKGDEVKAVWTEDGKFFAGPIKHDLDIILQA
jgi:hypothetical protein